MYAVQREAVLDDVDGRGCDPETGGQVAEHTARRVTAHASYKQPTVLPADDNDDVTVPCRLAGGVLPSLDARS
jgi:hypothetical protein